jgi:hypothetical protein
MYQRLTSLFLGLLALAFLTACIVEAPIQNVHNAPVPSRSGKQLTQKQVAEAIYGGCMDKGWRTKKIGPGHIVATLDHGKLMAQVDITYDNQDYDIKYKDSRNMRHSGNLIHKRYNGWIHYLDQAILKRMQQKLR